MSTTPPAVSDSGVAPQATIFPGTTPAEELDDPLLPTGDTRQLSVLFGTWNVGNAAPSSDAFELWLGEPKEDLVVVGLQECSWGDKEKHESHSRTSTTQNQADDKFLALLEAFLGPKGYKPVASRGLGQMKIAAYLKNGVTDVSCVGQEVEATGFVGVFPVSV